MKKVEIPEFNKLYNDGLNDSEISRIVGFNHVTIKNYRERLNLPSNFKYKRKFDTDKFLSLHKEGYNDAEIARLLNMSDSAINDYRNELKLEKNHYKYEEVNLTFEQEQVLIGTILGDAHLERVGKNARGEFTHSIKQERYCIWKRDFLKDFCAELYYTSQFHKVRLKNYYKVICRILTNPVFNSYYDLFYKDRVKVVNKELLWRLEGLGLAVWYMDDGSRIRDTYTIATNCFSKEDMDIIQEFFLKKFNIITTIHKNKNILYIKTCSAPTFKKLVEPYIIESMRYKITPLRPTNSKI